MKTNENLNSSNAKCCIYRNSKTIWLHARIDFHVQNYEIVGTMKRHHKFLLPRTKNVNISLKVMDGSGHDLSDKQNSSLDVATIPIFH